MMAFIPPTRLPVRVQRRHSVCTQTPRALLPAQPPILLEDLDNLLTSGQKSRLETTLRTLDETDTHLRVLTQNAANTPGRAVIQIFGLSEETALIVADTRGGNLLNFRVGESLQKRLPLSFWTELGNRYGNKFYVDEHGPDGALLDAVDKIKECSGRVCNVVPGISNDQLYVDIACAAIGGAVAGAASRTGGKKFNVSYLALFSPLWGIFLVSFGLGPVLTRVPTVSPEVGSVVAAFLAVALLVWAWVPARFGRPGQDGN